MSDEQACDANVGNIEYWKDQARYWKEMSESWEKIARSLSEALNNMQTATPDAVAAKIGKLALENGFKVEVQPDGHERLVLEFSAFGQKTKYIFDRTAHHSQFVKQGGRSRMSVKDQTLRQTCKQRCFSTSAEI